MGNQTNTPVFVNTLDYPSKKSVGLIKAYVSIVNKIATEIINKAQEESAKMIEFIKKREKAAEWMRLIQRVWREEAKWTQEETEANSTKWKIRSEGENRYIFFNLVEATTYINKQIVYEGP